MLKDIITNTEVELEKSLNKIFLSLPKSLKNYLLSHEFVMSIKELKEFNWSQTNWEPSDFERQMSEELYSS